MPVSKEDAKLLIDKLKDQSWYELSEWEEGFINNIKDQLEEGLELSPKQSLKLNDIYRKAYS